MVIVPDTKNWTWVLERPCPECGFESSTVTKDEIAELTRAKAKLWVGILSDNPAWLRRRVRADRWSTLEYGCHVRDVFRVMNARLNLMLTLDDPQFQNWDQDRTALEDHYEDQDPPTVAAELAAAAEALAAEFETVEGTAWQRRGIRSDGTSFTVETIGQYMLHDVVHHVDDVKRDLATPTS
jgi:DinB family protein